MYENNRKYICIYETNRIPLYEINRNPICRLNQLIQNWKFLL
jgi:hypothetical protein